MFIAKDEWAAAKLGSIAIASRYKFLDFSLSRDALPRLNKSYAMGLIVTEELSSVAKVVSEPRPKPPTKSISNFFWMESILVIFES